jgi:hypothetical protein
MKSSPLVAVAAALAFASAVAVHVARERVYPRAMTEETAVLYVRSPEVAKRLALGFDALAADMYWIRAIQNYGGDRLAPDRKEHRYALLYPLLELTTSLDPYFGIAYRFGAIFLSEAYPGGPGRPDQAIALLRKGIAAQPTKWQYYMDIGFVYYWSRQDYEAAAEWFTKGARLPGAPNWLVPVAASMLTYGQDRESARLLWRQLLDADQQWLRASAERRLAQLDALDWIDRVNAAIAKNPLPPGEPYSWPALIQRRVLRGVPVDPTGTPLVIDPSTGRVSVDDASPLAPMPIEPRRREQ